ncbi:ATP synthase subunit I [Paenibacillus zanthoxyli]|uniref:ATP synthase subunit I n=1 Tax=Paenibacillus zanthoxyli TaxID=369399 RepID=UPI0004715C8D|nr:ATP synthase subunit I [Paenibacillus zanthoxyli]
MNDAARMNKLMLMSIAGIIVVCAIIAELMPHRRTVLHGIVLGASVSCLNVFYMAYKVKGIAKSASGESKARATLGFGWRIATSILAVVLALEFPHYFNEIAVCASLATGYFVLPIVGFILLQIEERKHTDGKG